MTTAPTLSVIIVSYNTRSMTLECVRTLYERLEGISAEVFVVDNASRDGSAQAVAEAFPKVWLIANAANIGFGAANNLALRMAVGRYLLLLNTDAFPHIGCLRALVRYLDDHPRAGVAGPRLVNMDGSLQRSCWRFPTPIRTWLEGLLISDLMARHPAFDDYKHWRHDIEREVDFIAGACLLVRRDTYVQVGGFDERFFMYQEETDWQFRIKQAGWKVVFTPSGVVTHLGGASGKAEITKVNQIFFESLDRYNLKHYGRFGLAVNRIAQVVAAALRAGCWAAVSPLPRLRSRAVREVRLQSQFLRRHLQTGPPN